MRVKREVRNALVVQTDGHGALTAGSAPARTTRWKLLWMLGSRGPHAADAGPVPHLLYPGTARYPPSTGPCAVFRARRHSRRGVYQPPPPAAIEQMKAARLKEQKALALILEILGGHHPVPISNTGHPLVPSQALREVRAPRCGSSGPASWSFLAQAVLRLRTLLSQPPSC